MASRFRIVRASAVPAIAGVALVLAMAGTASAGEEPVCGDVNDSGDVTTSDALNVLRKAVGQNLNLYCGIENRFGDTDDYNETSIIQPNHLLGQLINVPRASTLTHWGIITRKGGGQVRFALYTDDGGSPGTLVTGSLVQPLELGVQEIVTGAPKAIAPGNYWLMANFDSVTEVAGDEDSGDQDIIKYKETSYLGNPGTFGEALQYTGQRLNYWIKVLN
jgi:hypothetical protein